jgi:hypothetical protein
MSDKISYVMIVLCMVVVYLCGLYHQYPEYDFIIRSFGFLLSCVVVLLGIAKFKAKT